MDDFFIEDVQKWDSRLFQLASYEVTSGLMVVPSSQEEILELQKKIASKFNYFKRLIQLGEITIDELSKSVFARNGAIFGLDKKKRDEEKDIDGLITRIHKKEQEKQSQVQMGLGVDRLIKEILGELNGGSVSRHPLEIIFSPIEIAGKKKIDDANAIFIKN